MPNRAERRSKNRNGVPDQYDQTRGRGRSGMIDEYALQEKSRRLKEGKSGPWKPTSSELEHAEEVAMDTDPDNFDPPQVLRAPHSARQWFRVASWVLIVVSAILFFVVMWIPNRPMWSIITIAAVFGAGVVSLFFTAGDPKNNPNLDQNGTAVSPIGPITDRWPAPRTNGGAGHRNWSAVVTGVMHRHRWRIT